MIHSSVCFRDMSENDLSDEAIVAVFDTLGLSTEDQRAARTFRAIGGTTSEQPTIALSARTSPVRKVGTCLT